MTEERRETRTEEKIINAIVKENERWKKGKRKNVTKGNY